MNTISAIDITPMIPPPQVQTTVQLAALEAQRESTSELLVDTISLLDELA